jgi:hypothetical protein
MACGPQKFPDKVSLSSEAKDCVMRLVRAVLPAAARVSRLTRACLRASALR